MSVLFKFRLRPPQAPPIERLWGWAKFAQFHFARMQKPVSGFALRAMLSRELMKETLIELETLDA